MPTVHLRLQSLRRWPAALALLGSLAASPLAFGQVFSDSFERDELGPDWTVSAQGGTAGISQASSHEGSRAVYLSSDASGSYKNISIAHHLSQPIYGRVSVWIDDTGADVTSSNYFIFYVGNTALGIGASVGTLDYDLGHNNGGEYVFTPWGAPSPSHSSVDRTHLWHHWEIEATPQSLSIRVDGTTVHSSAATGPFDVISLGMFGPEWRPPFTTYFDSVEVFAGEPGAWVRMPTNAPPARATHAMVYDTARDRVVLHAGGSQSGPKSDTWAWNGSAWNELISPTRPPARAHPALSYDIAHDQIVLFGGEINRPCTDPARYFGDTWTFNGSEWTQASNAGPRPRSEAAMTYDPALGLTLLFGGLPDCSIGLSDTWAWNGSSWENRQASQPGAHRGARAWFDTINGKSFIFGGYNGVLLHDRWEYDGSLWSPRNPNLPSPRQGHALAWDELDGQLVLFGGQSAEGSLADTWILQNGDWRSDNSPGPSPRSGHAMAYDAARAQVVLFGGRAPDGTFLDDTWVWSPRPVITRHPTDTSLCRLAPTTLSVVAQGVGPFEYEWTLDGVPLTDEPGHLAGSKSPSLVISHPSGKDRGAFACTVRNANGFSVSLPARTRFCDADYNCSGAVDSSDFFEFLGYFFLAVPEADFNADARVDSADFFSYITTFFSPCP